MMTLSEHYVKLYKNLGELNIEFISCDMEARLFKTAMSDLVNKSYL